MQKRLLNWMLPVAGGLILYLIWILFKVIGGQEDWILPWPGQILAAIGEEFSILMGAAIQTGASALVGFLFSIVVGIGLSVLLASAQWVRTMWYPWVIFFQMVPVIVLAPIFVLWYGQGLPSIVAITFMITFFPIVANTTMGLVSTDKNLIDLFTTLNASTQAEVFMLRVPFALPYFLTGLKISGTLAPIGALVGDFYAGEASGGKGGLGYLVVSYSSQLETAALFATALVACLLGFVFVSGVNYLHWLLLHNWHESAIRRET
ncbi:ABC transporter permease [Pelagicoccus albus]|uniref:ABC transporter permease n=1 Tax=Pelagicoccus albus TaxID=415222 RepID=A0A7X1EBL5_9BACT|nr:ABC transporter permease [Pelagicoccus albus]MBC2607942.1 ABC transporter permease [Pelagicoccus albus]